MHIEAEGFPEDSSKIIYCGWHGRSLMFADHFRNRGYWVIISQSYDGDMQNRVFSLFGFNTIRGSTNRGGVRAAIEAIRALKKGGTMAMTPDGPRGPSGVIQGGVMTMAQRSGAALVPVGISANPRIIVKSWDKYLVPLPFSKGVLIAGDPIYVSEDASLEEVEEIRLHLQRECHRMQEVAELRVGVKEPLNVDSTAIINR